jgi:hypothetical protein
VSQHLVCVNTYSMYLGPHHGGQHAAVEGAPPLLPQHLARAVRDAGVAAGRGHRQPRLDQLQRVDDGLQSGACNG